jgi:hypothetical protein
VRIKGEDQVAGNDPWVGVTWKVLAGGVNLKPAGQAGQFTLTAVVKPATGAVAYYTVNFVPGSMPACWAGVLLHPRGNSPFPPPVPPLPPYSQGSADAWSAAATAALQELNVSMSRLEGDLYPGPNAQALTLVRVDNATTQDTPLLALKLVAAPTSGGVQPLDDGTAYGTH